MKVRIKVCRNFATGSFYYKVQTKTFLLWKTKWETAEHLDAIDFANNIKCIDKYNKLKDVDSISFVVYGVRQQYVANSGYSSEITLFKDYPELDTGSNAPIKNRWIGDRFGELKVDQLFGEKVLEPKAYKITIEPA